MARQKFEKGQRVVTCSWRNEWKEAEVVEPEVMRRSYGSRKEQPWAVVRYPDDERTFEVLNDRRHILNMEEYAPIGEAIRRQKEAKQRNEDLTKRRRDARYEFHARELADLATASQKYSTWGQIWEAMAQYLKHNFREQRSFGSAKGPADTYAEEQVPA
jgi:hypothetical protein